MTHSHPYTSNTPHPSKKKEEEKKALRPLFVACSLRWFFVDGSIHHQQEEIKNCTVLQEINWKQGNFPPLCNLQQASRSKAWVIDTIKGTTWRRKRRKTNTAVLLLVAQITNDQSASLKFLGNKADYPAADIGFQMISFDGNSQICYPKQNNKKQNKTKQKTTSSNQCSNTVLHISIFWRVIPAAPH